MAFGRYKPPILAQIVMLVAGAIAAALLAMLLITFRGPPPVAAPVAIPDLARIIAGPPRREVRLRDQIVRQRIAARLEPPPDKAENSVAALALARAAAIPPATVRVYTRGEPWGSLGTGFAGDGSGRPSEEPPIAARELRGEFMIAVRRGDGWLLYQSEERLTGRWFLVTGLAIAAIFFGLLILAWLIARHITKPLSQLSDHVTERTVVHAVSVRASGPPEVRRLFAAFNDMQARLAGYIEERTVMLAAIAHDLRTPLTRLSFRLDSLPDMAREKAQADIAEMQDMIASVLEFVKGSAQPTAMARVDVAALVQTLVDDLADMGKPAKLGLCERAIVMADAQALRRCFSNIVENALRYAGDAEISLTASHGHAIVAINDQGPGIAAEHLPHVFEPFYRAEQSRSRLTGGAGLGMAIARNIVERHGGSITLANRENCGLRVEMAFPLASRSVN